MIVVTGLTLLVADGPTTVLMFLVVLTSLTLLMLTDAMAWLL
jgi:hypothetical protein